MIVLGFKNPNINNSVKMSVNNIIKQKIIKQKIIKQNIIKQNIIKQNIIKQNIIKQNIIKQNIINQNIIKQNIINQKLLINNNNIINDKIICVGQPKTGTKTLKSIFKKLGKTVSGDPLCFLNNSDYTTIDGITINTDNFFNNIGYLHKNLDMFDFFHDVPYSFNYELIDKKYSNSKFILTIRDEEEWFNSLIIYQHLPNASSCSLLNVIYHHGIILEEYKEEVIELYRKYNNDVITYFKNTPENLLIINLCDKNKCETDIIQKICDFTNLNTPNNFVFPHDNSQKYV
jgi:hypothetical protein